MLGSTQNGWVDRAAAHDGEEQKGSRRGAEGEQKAKWMISVPVP